MNNMLKNLKTMIQNPKMKDVLGMLEQLMKDLLGKNRLQWQEDLADLLRRQSNVFLTDDQFNMGIWAREWEPFNLSLERELGPAEIVREFHHSGYRMGTVEEAISYMNWQVGDVSTKVFSHFGPNKQPCAVCFSRKGGRLRTAIASNSETVRWLKEARFLVFVIK